MKDNGSPKNLKATLSALKRHITERDLFEAEALVRAAVLDAFDEGKSKAKPRTPAVQPDNAPREFPLVICAADVEPRAVDWLVYPYLPRSKVALLTGDPGDGKSTLAVHLCAELSRGRVPFSTEGATVEPARSLYLTQEDGLDDTMRPRLDAADADPRLVHFLQVGAWIDPADNTQKEFQLSLKNINLIREAMDRVQPSLVVIDPIQSFLGGGVDMNRANEVREALRGLIPLAEEFEACILLLRHRVKSTRTKAKMSGQGNVDFTGLARSELITGMETNEDGTESRFVFHTKSNLAANGPTIRYSIGTYTAGNITASAFDFLGTCDRNVDEVLTPADRPAAPKRMDAMEWLAVFLADGPRRQDVLKAAAAAAGHSWATIRRAADTLGIIRAPQHRKGIRGATHHEWALDDGSGLDA